VEDQERRERKSWYGCSFEKRRKQDRLQVDLKKTLVRRSRVYPSAFFNAEGKKRQQAGLFVFWDGIAIKTGGENEGGKQVILIMAVGMACLDEKGVKKKGGRVQSQFLVKRGNWDGKNI